MGLFEKYIDIESDNTPGHTRKAPSILRQHLSSLQNGIYILYTMRGEHEGAEGLLLYKVWILSNMNIRKMEGLWQPTK